MKLFNKRLWSLKRESVDLIGTHTNSTDNYSTVDFILPL